jgi:hypothetical protein
MDPLTIWLLGLSPLSIDSGHEDATDPRLAPFE